MADDNGTVLRSVSWLQDESETSDEDSDTRAWLLQNNELLAVMRKKIVNSNTLPADYCLVRQLTNNSEWLQVPVANVQQVSMNIRYSLYIIHVEAIHGIQWNIT